MIKKTSLHTNPDFLIPPRKPMFPAMMLNLFKLHEKGWFQINQEDSLKL